MGTASLGVTCSSLALTLNWHGLYDPLLGPYARNLVIDRLIDWLQVGIPILGVVENMSGLRQQLHQFKFFSTDSDGSQQDVTQQVLQHLPAELQVPVIISHDRLSVQSSWWCYSWSACLLLGSHTHELYVWWHSSWRSWYSWYSRKCFKTSQQSFR